MIFNNINVSMINKDIIRVQKYRFQDKNTLFIPTKNNFENLQFSFKELKDRIIINFHNYFIHILKNKDIVYIKNNDKILYKFDFKFTNGELPLPINTPIFFHINDNPQIELKDGGYSLKGAGKYSVFENSFDMYIMFSNKDHKKLRKLYTFLTKPSEFVRLSTLGCFNSRYYPYSSEEALSLMDKFNEFNLPLDNFVIDTDWRKAKERGIGYEINDTLFKDLKDFFSKAHQRNIEIMFNDHPEPFNNKQLFDEEEIKYREDNLKNIFSYGLDYWWYDRNWITKLISPTKLIAPETLGMYAFYEITQNYFKEASSFDIKHYKRPVIMGNVNNIINGEYKEILDIASHRYSIQWSGDITSTMSSLTQEISNMIKCSLNCLAYYSSDLGGHIGDPTKEEYIKWIQFGTFEPIFRPHCTCSVKRFREPFNYDEETVNIFRNYTNLRYRLLPFIYKEAFETYQNGLPFIRALSLNYPNDKKANNNYSTFMLSDKLLISPLIDTKIVPLTIDNYVGKVKAKFFNNINLEGNTDYECEFDTLNFELNGNSIHESIKPYDFTAIFEFKLKFNNNIMLYAAIDDGSIFYIDDKEVYSDWNYHGAAITKIIKLEKNKIYNFKMKYLQGGGQAKVALYKQIIRKENNTKVYLPSSTFFNLFTGEIINGPTTLKIKNTYEFLPLFVKCGSIIPLVKEVNNTKSIDWKHFLFDYYPSKEEFDNDYIYEDDHQTVAYQYNEYRKTNYVIKYNKHIKSYIFILNKANGEYKDSYLLRRRTITFKFENIYNETIKSITINGKDVPFTIFSPNKNTFPLSFSLSSKNNETIVFKFNERLDKRYIIKINVN